ncbi:transmembrane protein 179 [Patella vulgata]|uniref:transmembrane protein 179 n=1 Tax=Patella vulgata TaxID=6465 RepID=UPI00217F9298|nr:transmembrane protein 179 [Patella vulgata]
MKIPDVQLFIQALLYLTIVFTGFTTAISVGLTTMNFDGNCILYSDVNWKNATFSTFDFSDKVNCNFPVYFNVFACIFFSLGMFCYFTYAICQKDPNIGSQMWVMPFVLISAAMAIVSFIVSCIISVGFKTLCDGITSSPGRLTSCSQGQRMNWNAQRNTDYNGSHYYAYFTVAQTASWIGFLAWVIQCALGIVRFVRNRRLRSQAYDNSVNADTAKIGDVEPTA